jgi:light-regulated signal transduction histidine kinase (bacteriophytochrome)
MEVAVRQRADEALHQLNLTLEQRVRQRTVELEEANRELEAFSYSVSHDLRAPLRAIEGFSQQLQKHYHASLDERGKDYLGRVCRASERMSELIDDMLHLSQVGRQPLVKIDVDLSALALGVARDLRQAAPAQAGVFEIAPGMKVEADQKLIRIVLENLMGNAWKFSARHAAPVITVGIGADGAVFVHDNGAGFSMDYVHKLFTPFQRLHSAADFAGTGIGLATVQRIIHRHGGRVWAAGAEGRGATFHFTCAGHAEQAIHV